MNKRCKYCDSDFDNKEIINRTFSLGVFGKGFALAVIDVFSDNLKISVGSEDGDCLFFEKAIKFCPMCGRKLKGEEE